jgi:hypothetical protein
MNWSDYEIKRVDKLSCKEFLLKHHYLSKQGFSFRSGYNYGLFCGDKLIGVAIFHTVSAKETIKGCFGLDGNDQTGFGNWDALLWIQKTTSKTAHHGSFLGASKHLEKKQRSGH